jgi:hypothetical protein
MGPQGFAVRLYYSFPTSLLGYDLPALLTTPLKGLWSHMKRGFYHDGRFATLPDVITHYDTLMALGLTAPEKSDLAEYLKSI